MNIPYYHVDAFTRGPFSGNPAGVCPLAEWLPDDLLQAIAAENNLAETAYVVSRGAHYDLRWFSPAMEVDLCGHATLATSHVLFEHLGLQGSTVQYQTRSGLLTVHRDHDVLTLDFPCRPGKPCEAAAELASALGVRPLYTSRARDYLAVFESEDVVRGLKPDMAAIERLDALGVIATAPGRESDFVSRFFAPRAGVPEDPVCGSAHCTLIPYWSERLGRSRLRALQVSSRGGELFCEHQGDRVRIGGRARTYAAGFVHVT